LLLLLGLLNVGKNSNMNAWDQINLVHHLLSNFDQHSSHQQWAHTIQQVDAWNSCSNHKVSLVVYIETAICMHLQCLLENLIITCHLTPFHLPSNNENCHHLQINLQISNLNPKRFHLPKAQPLGLNLI
jgi:hypothetical protein